MMQFLNVDWWTPADLSEPFSQEMTVCGLLLPQVYRNLQYFVPLPGKHKKDESGKKARLELLKTISGSAVPGQLTALMGGPGAGKVRPSPVATLIIAALHLAPCCATCSRYLLRWSFWLDWTCCRPCIAKTCKGDSCAGADDAHGCDRGAQDPGGDPWRDPGERLPQAAGVLGARGGVRGAE